MVAWSFLCYLRRKNFTIPPWLGLLTFNIFALTHCYLVCYALAANTSDDPNTKVLYYSFVLSDSLFGFLYAALSDYLFPSGLFWFSAVPKVFFAVSFYFYFDDRLW